MSTRITLDVRCKQCFEPLHTKVAAQMVFVEPCEKCKVEAVREAMDKRDNYQFDEGAGSNG